MTTGNNYYKLIIIATIIMIIIVILNNNDSNKGKGTYCWQVLARQHTILINRTKNRM